MDSIIWVCVNNNNHIFDTKTAEEKGYFCPKCPNYEGILIQMNNQTTEPPPVKPSVRGSEGGRSTHTTQTESLPAIFVPPSGPVDDLGLCIMLLDCSGSMSDPAFIDHPMLKIDLIAKGVSEGIFSLSGNPLKEYAYILIIGFDHKVDILIPYMNIKKVVEEFEDASSLQRFIKAKMEKKKGATDINGALEAAFGFTQNFINSNISLLGDYKPRIQMVLDDDLMSHQIPNVRVLLFTDGGQFMGEGKTTINPSPFKNLQYDGKTIDLLMGAYYGTTDDKDYYKLRDLVSKCPRHPEIDQFFLFDSPTKVPNLKGLFRMASGASGFCPVCLDEANTVTRDL